MVSLRIPPSTIRDLCAELREARFAFLLDESNGLLADTWSTESGRVRYWPGGELNETFFELCPKESELISKFCTEYNYEVLGVGCGRVVLSPIDSGLAIKIARYGMSARLGDGREANQIEIDRWKQIRSQPLAQIYAWDSISYDWLVMKAAIPLTEASLSATTKREICEEIESEIETHSDIVPTVDVRPANVGRIDEEWVLLDYGKPFYEDEYMYGLFPSAVHQFVLESSKEHKDSDAHNEQHN